MTRRPRHLSTLSCRKADASGPLCLQAQGCLLGDPVCGVSPVRQVELRKANKNEIATSSMSSPRGNMRVQPPISAVSMRIVSPPNTRKTWQSMYGVKAAGIVAFFGELEKFLPQRIPFWWSLRKPLPFFLWLSVYLPPTGIY